MRPMDRIAGAILLKVLNALFILLLMASPSSDTEANQFIHNIILYKIVCLGM